MQRILGGSAADERYRLYNSIAAERAHLYLGAADRLFIE
jgi:hypothetical protein